MAIWAELVEEVEAIRRLSDLKFALPHVLSHALAEVAARALAVEFLDPLGLSGLGVPAMTAVDDGREAECFVLDARFAFLTSLLELLLMDGSLGQVGEALLDVVRNLRAVDGDVVVPVLPSQVPAAAVEKSATETLFAWFAESLFEAICDAAQKGDVNAIHAFVGLCESLGSVLLVDAVRSMRSRTMSRYGKTPLALAQDGKHFEAARLLAEGRPTHSVVA